MKIQDYSEIKTERLLLRKLEESDSDVILFLRSDETVNKFIERSEDRKTKNNDDALKFIRTINEEIRIKKSVTWGIALGVDPKIIGTICLWNFSEDRKTAEVGYGLNPTFHNKGIMSEALSRVINYGFNDLNLDMIEAFTHKENKSSRKILDKNGFHLNENRKDKDNLMNLIFEIRK